MKKFRSWILSIIMILIGTTCGLAGCDEYRRLELTLVKSEVVVFLSDNPEENIFDVSATISGYKSGTSTNLRFEILTAQSSIEEYGEPIKKGDTTTQKYLAKKRGTVQIHISTVEGGKTEICTVSVEEPIKDITFTNDSLAINRGAEKDILNFIKFEPNETSQTNILVSLVVPGEELPEEDLGDDVVDPVEPIDEEGEGDGEDEESDPEGEDPSIEPEDPTPEEPEEPALPPSLREQVIINGTKVFVTKESTITEFTLRITSVDNPEIVKTILVEVVDTINTLRLEYNDASLANDYVEVDVIDGVYTLQLAQNAPEEYMYKKFLKLKGLFIDSEDTTDMGYITSNGDYSIKMLTLNQTTGVFENATLPYDGEFFEISKQLDSNGAFQILQRRKGEQTVKFVVDYKGYEGEFTTEVTLNIKVIGLPTQIEVLYEKEVTDTITLFDVTTGTLTGTTIELNVIGVGDEILKNEPLLISFQTEGQAKIDVFGKMDRLNPLNLSKAITMGNDSPLLLRHTYNPDEESPNDLYMLVTSVNYNKVFAKVKINFIRGEISLGIVPEYRIPYGVNDTELEIVGLSNNFDKKLLKFGIADEQIVKIDQSILETENKVVLVPQGKFGSTTLVITAPNGVKSRTCKITVFEELLNTTTVTFFGNTFVPSNMQPEVTTVVVKTSNTYGLTYRVNEKYDHLITGMTSEIILESVGTSQTLAKVIDGAIRTNAKTGIVKVTVKITGYNDKGELSKSITYVFNIEIKAPLLSATPNAYVANIYDRNSVKNYENQYAKYTISYKVNPVSASFTADDLTWVIKVGNEISEPIYISAEVVGGETITRYTFNYADNLVYIETTSQNIQTAVVYCDMSTGENFVFNVICQIRQVFPNEKGVDMISVNEDVNVIFTVSKPIKVRDIILNNVTKTSLPTADGGSIVKNSYTFDTRDMTIANDGKFTSGNVYVVNYDISPANATIQELSVTHTQASSDLEVFVDEENKTITIKVNRQINGETTIYITAQDSVGSMQIVQQEIYLKVANGTFENPFEIQDAEGIDKIRHSLKSHYVLIADVDLSSISNFTPIGTKDAPFTGSLNGAHKITLGNTSVNVYHIITSLKINLRQSDTTVSPYIGLFGYVGETGAVLNVNLQNVSINLYDRLSQPETFVGAIAGFSKGLIYNCTVTDSSNIQSAKISTMFTDSTILPGISYRVQTVDKKAYVGGVVGMLVGVKDLTENFADNLDLIAGINYSFENNKAYMAINAVSTIEASAVVAGGLVGVNLGANVYTSNTDVESVVTAINTIPGNNSSNLNSVYGGVVGVNLGTVTNYVAKPYINGLEYVGGVVGYNLGTVTNTTVLPVIRGRLNVGGLVGYNVTAGTINSSSLITTALPKIANVGELVINDTYAISSDLYSNIFELTIDGIYIKTVGLLKDNKVQFVDNNQTLSVYNTAVIGEVNVGGLVGYNYQVGSRSNETNPLYTFDCNIVNNSVYSYVTKELNKYSQENNYSQYYGDVVVVSSYAAHANVGGLIGFATHANIEKAFVNANISVITPNTNNVGGLIGKVGESGNGMLRIVDSHTNGVVYSYNSVGDVEDNIGSFVGNADDIFNVGYGLLPQYVDESKADMYNIQSSYSVLREMVTVTVQDDELTTVQSTTNGYVNGFSGTNTLVDHVVGGNVAVQYDKLTAINSFYIGFTINFVAKKDGENVTGFDFDTPRASVDPANIGTITFTYEGAQSEYILIGEDRFYYFNQNLSYNFATLGKFISYTNFVSGEAIKISNEDEPETFTGIYPNVSRPAIDSKYRFVTYFIENENAEEDGFGVDSKKLTENGETFNVIDTTFNWYHNIYEYTNPKGDGYKAYNGLPIILNSQPLFTDGPTRFDNRLNFVVDLPPMGIDVTFTANYVTTFPYKDEIVLTFAELDSKYYNSDGTLTEFNGLGTVEKQNFSLDIKNSISKANTYILKEVIDITALPKFVGVTSLEYRSVNGLLKFGYNEFGQEVVEVVGSGKDQIVITSKYNREVTYTANVNIVSKLNSVSLQRTQRSTTPISSLHIVKDVESSFFAKTISRFSKMVNSQLRVFDLVQRQDIGIRYYFANQIMDSLSIYHDSELVEAPFELNGLSNFVCEEVEIAEGITKYVYYIDVASSEVSILGKIATASYATIFAVPYIVLNNENFFIVKNEDIETVANSFVKGVTGEVGTFGITNNLVSPLQIRIFNETFNLKVDKTDVEFSAYTQPKITVTLGTDNFDDELYYVVSNGTQETLEQNIGLDASKITVLDNLQVLATAPVSNVDGREKVYEFELSVLKVDGIYQTITNDTPMLIVFYTKENGETKFIKSCNVTIIPQPVNEISILHYPSSEYEEKVSPEGIIEFVPKSNEVAYENIIPGYTGLLKINLSPYYGNVSSISITSNVVQGKSINFEQLVYHEYESSYSYQTAYPLADRTENGIVAIPRSKVLQDAQGNDYYVYDGNLYIRTILPSNTLTGSMFVITVTAYAIANGQQVVYPSKTIELEAITPPGLHMTYKGSSNGVVAIGTDNIFQLKGEGLDNAIIDFNKSTRINFPTGQFEDGVGGSVRVVNNNDGTYTLSVSRDVPQGTTINLVAYTERVINNKTYTAEAKLTLKVAKFVVEGITVQYVTNGVFETKLHQNRELLVKIKDVSYNPYLPGIERELDDFEMKLSTKLNNEGLNSVWYKRTYNMDGSFNDQNLVEGDYGTFVILVEEVSENEKITWIRNTVKSTTDILVAKAVINYQFSSNNIEVLTPSAATIPNGLIDAEYTVELECEFTFNVLRDTNDETPEPISNVEQFLAMEEGINYILTDDIVLTNYKPISTAIASLDGNGYVITIQNFDTALEYNSEGNVTTNTNEINLGLFDVVSEDTILKNITLEIVPLSTLHGVREEADDATQDMLIDVSAYEAVNFGFIAATNKGSITNAQVVNDKLANEIRAEREAMLADSIFDYEPKTYTDVAGRTISVVKVQTKESSTNSQIAGLVAINEGYITNSRVENITINGAGYVAGIAVRNSNTISSTYYKGANLLNQSSDLITEAGTAGLVVFNESNATIEYCYTMARESWTYQHEVNDEDEEVEGSIVWDVNSDISGISTAEKNLFTGVYNSSTLQISDGSEIVTLTGETDPLYLQAIQSLRRDTALLTLRAVNSGINVDTDAAGFVYENNGTISNSYANMLVSASHSAGFVFQSGDNGLIEDCYSLSSVRIESDAHSPFTGKTINDVTNAYNATINNISYSHYLSIDETFKFEYDDGVTKKPYTITLKDKFYDTDEPATKLTSEELRAYASFQGYAFNNDFETNVEILRSVWFVPTIITAESYDTYNVLKDNFKHSYYAPNRPELVAANIRTMSVRYLLDSYETSETLTYSYAGNLEIGLSIRNPYLVYNATTFNDYGTLAYGNVNKNYMRFISDITFEGESLNDIKAETYNIDFSGDIDGNGMSINELKLIAESNLETTDKIEHLGLFGRLCETEDEAGNKFNAIVRNLNINVSSIDGTGVMYVGSLAGEMNNASAFNIRVLGENVYVNGQNAVGGVVGRITGDSELVNVQTNVSVSATNKSTLTGYNFNAYDQTEETLKAISYAGGVVGVVDVNDRGDDVKTAQKYARIRKIDVYGNTTISGDIVGGLFGYVGTLTTASDTHFTITNDGISAPRLVAKYSAGGLIGENRGKIERSYIAHSNQTEINEEIKTNLNTSTHNSTGSDKVYSRLFNSSALAQSYFIGGIAGINLGGTISDSYTNVNVINGVSYYAGGVVGMNAGGTIKSVYTTGSVYAKTVGGFIGMAVNGGWLEDGLTINEGEQAYLSVTALKEEGFIINNIKELLDQVDLGSLILNSAVSANVWRQEDLDKMSYSNIASFIGKAIDTNKINKKLISTASQMSREMAETNVFVNASVEYDKVTKTKREIQEIAQINSGSGYSITESPYEEDNVPNTDTKYVYGRYGVLKKEETQKYYYYSRLKEYGSLRTMEEIINRTMSTQIATLQYENAKSSALESGAFVKYKVSQTNPYNLPKIYKGWSAIYWEGTGTTTSGEADSTQVFPGLIARPNVAVVRVYDIEDLKLIYTLLSSEFILMNDIDLSEESWTPVGTETDPFTGMIHSDTDSNGDYNNWTIKNVSISSSEGNSVGLLGTISGAELHNFNVNIERIAIDKSTEYELNVGGLVGLVDAADLSKIHDILVIGGNEVSEPTAGETTTVVGVGTSTLTYEGVGEIIATNVSTMGGAIGSSLNAEINNVNAVNLHIYTVNNVNLGEETNGGAFFEDDGDFNAFGGVIGFYNVASGTTVVSNLNSKNVKLLDSVSDVNYTETVYIGGAIGYAKDVYLRNINVTDFHTGKGCINTEKDVYAGGAVGYVESGIVFNVAVVNAVDPEDSDLVAATSIDKTLYIKVSGNAGDSKSAYVGGVFGLISGVLTNYSAIPQYIGAEPVRTDNNPFAQIGGNSYVVTNVTNSIVSNIEVEAIANNSQIGEMFVGGIAGKTVAKLYNAITYGNIKTTTEQNLYVGGAIGQAQNNYIQNIYSYRDLILMSKDNTDVDNYSVIAGGVVGEATSIGNALNTDIVSNIVSNGNIVTALIGADGTVSKSLYHKIVELGGVIGNATNVAVDSAISNANINATLPASAQEVLYIGGFVGSFVQTNGGVNAIIRNSYSTGVIELTTSAYIANGGVGGFVGYVSTQTENKTLDAGGNSASIVNCYTISRVVTTNTTAFYDNERKGGFLGYSEQNSTSTPLVNCYFNKELFSVYENSSNEFVTKRYNSSKNEFTRDFGKGLTLNTMLYGIANKSGTSYISELASAIADETISNKNGTEIVVDATLGTKVNNWTIENNKYPTLNFVFEAYTVNEPNPEDLNARITKILYYDYQSSYTTDNIYNIRYLLSGSGVEFVENAEPINGGVLFDGNIYISQNTLSEENLVVSQRYGSKQNPLYYEAPNSIAEVEGTYIDSGVYEDIDGEDELIWTINLGKEVNEEFKHDFTNKAVIIDVENVEIVGTYGANSNTLSNATILFKNTSVNSRFDSYIDTMDSKSLIYGFNGELKDILIAANYGTIRTIKASQSTAFMVSENYGIIEDIKITCNGERTFILENAGIVNSVEYTVLITSATEVAYEMIGANTGYVKNVTLNAKTNKAEHKKYSNNDPINIALVNVYTSVTNIAYTNIENRRVYYYFSSNGVKTMLYDKNIEIADENKVDGKTTTFFNDSKGSIYRTFITSYNGANERMHAINFFGATSTSQTLDSDRFEYQSSVDYDFANDWVILTGTQYNNMPILRTTLQSTYYNRYIASGNYWVGSNTTDFMVGTAQELANVAYTISNATSGTYNVYIEDSIDLANKLWTPINVYSTVVVNLIGYGDSETDLTKYRAIRNISVLETRNHAGFFGTVFGKVNVSNLVFEYGYVASVMGYEVSVEDDTLNTVVDSTKKYDTLYSVGAVVGYAYGPSPSTNVLTINRVGTQYVYVAGNSEYDFYVAGQIGYAERGYVGIKDSYVNSPFMCYENSNSSGFVNGNSNLYMSNTYVTNMDIYLGLENYYVENPVANSSGFATGASQTINTVTYANTAYNYYLSNIETANTHTTGTSIVKLKTSILPQFDWVTNWTRLQGVNDGLPYNLTEIEYWINEGKQAVAGTDYVQSGSTYTIKSEEGLAWISYQVDNGVSFAGLTIELDKALFDLSGKVWTPIGRLAAPFQGTIRSKVSGGSIVRFIQASNFYSLKEGGTAITENEIGLFGYVSNANISDIEIQGSIISGTNNVGSLIGHALNTKINNVKVGLVPDTSEPTYVTGKENVGGIVGQLQNSLSSTTRHGAVISNSSSEALVRGTTATAGIVGYLNSGVVQLSENNGVITADNYATTSPSNIGGIVGHSKGSIYEVINNANIVAYGTVVTSSTNVGGIVGYMPTTDKNQLINSLNYGDVSGTDYSSTGLIVGNAGTYTANDYKIITSYSTATKYINGAVSTATMYVGNYSSVSQASYEFGQKATSSINEIGDSSIWYKDASNNYVFDPVDANTRFNVTQEYVIASSDDYDYVTYLVNKRPYYNYENGKDKFDVEVTTNITIENKRKNTSEAYAFQGDFVSSTSGTQRTITVNEPTNYTTGSGFIFDTIKNSNIKDIKIVLNETINASSVNYVGLLAGKIYDSTIINVATSLNQSITAGSYVGSIAGYAEDVSFEDCSSSSKSINGVEYVGGIVGRLSGSSNMTSTNTTIFKNTINVSGDKWVGGIAGYIGSNAAVSKATNDGDIKANSASSSHTVGGIVGYMAGTIDSCTNTGDVYAKDENAGGIAGQNIGTVKNCTSSGIISSDAEDVGGIVGENNGTVTSNTFTGTVKGYKYLGGIVGYSSSGNATSNTMNGNIEILRTDTDDGKVKSTIGNFGFGYSITHNNDVTGRFDFNAGNKVYKGRVDFPKYIKDNNIHYVVGNDENVGSNTVDQNSRITLKDKFTSYVLSVHSKDSSKFEFVYTEYKVWGTFKVSAEQIEDPYFIYSKGSEEQHPAIGTTSKEEYREGFDNGVFGISNNFSTAVDLLKDSVSGHEFDFTGTW